ncbi:MAG: threonine--tRNA ligase [Candidatus Heimdallarchaeaceae archaeon]
MVKVRLPDNSIIEVKKGATVAEVAEQISVGLAKNAIFAKVNEKPVDLSYKIEEDCTLELVTKRSEEALHVLNHSAAHIMAEAVVMLFPDAKPTIGPSLDPVGFYYDFYVSEPFSQEDIGKIEAKMKEIIDADTPFVREELPKEKAIDYYTKDGNKFKVEILEELEDETVSFYSHDNGRFKDLCRGPHIPSTGKVKAVKLLNVASAFWRGDSKRESLQRVYGVAFFSKQELKKHLQMLEEAKKRDHRVLGPQLDLFNTAEQFGPGMPLYYPKGAVLWDIIEQFWRKEHRKAGYNLVRTPHLFKEEVWRISGHVDYFIDNMFSAKGAEEKYFVKPMNCPGHMMIYNRKSHSYRELPVRLAEFGTVYRNELSGVLHGFLRLRGFTQDDSHIFMLPSQLEDEIVNVLTMVDHFYKTFGFESWEFSISTKPDKAIGSDEIWEHATNALTNALKRLNKPFKVKEKEGAFYGPKIDVDVRDALGRAWQCATIQVDFNLPERFDLTYIGEDGQKHRPVVVHRVILGAVDRFIAVLIEHYAGKLPVWLSPIQAVIIPITDRNVEYAKEVASKLQEAGIRAEADLSGERMEYKIRQAQLQKIPYMISVGDKEIAQHTIAVRTRDGKVQFGVKIEDFIQEVLNKVKNYQ